MCIHIILLYTPLAFAGLELRQPFCFFFYIIIICLAIVDGEHYTSTLSSSCIIYVFTCIAYYSYKNLNIKSCIERQKKKNVLQDAIRCSATAVRNEDDVFHSWKRHK